MEAKLSTLRPKVVTLDTRKGSGAAVQRTRGWKLTKIRERILLRDGYECQRCRRVSAHLEVDHIMPLHLGGRESDANRQSLCSKCHGSKSVEEERGRGGVNP